MSAVEQLKSLQAKGATAKAQHVAAAQALSDDDSARSINAEADVLGLPRPHKQLSEVDRAKLSEAQAACTRIMEFVSKQLPAAQQDVENEARRIAQGQHVRSEIIPPLESAAIEAGQIFGRALASLAAAEDLALRLSSWPGAVHGEGNAAALCTAMRSTVGRNIYCDVGEGRGAWDWAGYTEMSARLEQQIREISA